MAPGLWNGQSPKRSGQQWVHQRDDNNDETHIDSINSRLSMAAVAQIVKSRSAQTDWSQPHRVESTTASPLLSYDPSSQNTGSCHSHR
jgi:hypothetical protein